MSYVPPVVDFVAKKIARTPGVELSAIARDGGINAVLEGGYNRPLRAHVLGIGQRAMVPVRVFYRMSDGRAIGEGTAVREFEENRLQHEAIEDYYTRIHVAGFAGEPLVAPPEEVAGDSYGTVDVTKDVEARDKSGQLKLKRIRANTRGRPVVGWAYGDQTVRKGCKVKFKKPAALQWTMGRTMSVKAGSKGTVTSLSSKSPIAYLSMGGHDQIELPIHAVGHVYDVMVDPKLESTRPFEEDKTKPVNDKLGYLTPELKRLVMTVGFGRRPDDDDTRKNTAKFRGPDQPDMHGYSSVAVSKTSGGVDASEGISRAKEDDMLVPRSAKPTDKPDDDRTSHVRAQGSKMKVQIGKDGFLRKKTILLGRS